MDVYFNVEPWMDGNEPKWRCTFAIGKRTETGIGRTPEMAAQVCFAKWRDVLANKDWGFNLQVPFGWPVRRDP